MGCTAGEQGEHSDPEQEGLGRFDARLGQATEEALGQCGHVQV
jgi:hypothetical protein